MNKKQLGKSKALGTYARSMALNCYRNTGIEDLHAGTFPSSRTGDYTDVKVVTPYGEIPWNELGRISDEEMSELNHEVVNKIYTFLMIEMRDRDLFANMFFNVFTFPTDWDEPELDGEIVRAIRYYIKFKNLEREK